MRLLAFIGVAGALAVGGGAAAYFLVGGSSPQRPPLGQRNPILEQALDRGVISGYRVVGDNPRWYDWRYALDGAPVTIRYENTCPGSCPAGSEWSLLFIEYQHRGARQAQALQAIARRQMPYARIKAFETTTLAAGDV